MNNITQLTESILPFLQKSFEGATDEYQQAQRDFIILESKLQLLRLSITKRQENTDLEITSKINSLKREIKSQAQYDANFFQNRFEDIDCIIESFGNTEKLPPIEFYCNENLLSDGEYKICYIPLADSCGIAKHIPFETFYGHKNRKEIERNTDPLIHLLSQKKVAGNIISKLGDIDILEYKQIYRQSVPKLSEIFESLNRKNYFYSIEEVKSVGDSLNVIYSMFKVTNGEIYLDPDEKYVNGCYQHSVPKENLQRTEILREVKSQLKKKIDLKEA
jgi:hypothetical protein